MPEFSKNTHKKLYLIFRGGMSLGLLSYLLVSLDWRLIRKILVDANLFVMCLSFLLMNVSVLLSTFKWKAILRNLNRDVEFYSLARLYYEGTFLNNFFLSNIGGDGFKFFRLSQQIESRQDALVSILIDRLTGVLVLVSLCFLSLFLFFNAFSLSLRNIIGQHLGMSASIATIILMGGVFCFIFRRNIASIRKNYLSDKNPFTIVVLVVSFLFYVLIFATNYLIGIAYGLDIRPVYYIMFLPMIMIVLFLPFSLNGVGLREMAFIFLFGLVGVEKESAFLLGITPYILLLATSLMGGIFLVLGHKRVPRPE